VLFLGGFALCAAMFVSGAEAAQAVVPGAGPAKALRASNTRLAAKLEHNPFRLPIHLESTETKDTLQGSIHARVAYPFAVVNTALDNPAHWCDVLMLHLNTKYCRVATGKAGTLVTVNAGAKHEQDLKDSYRINFSYRVVATTPEYFQVQLKAAEGPLSTHDYRIALEAVSIDAGHTFLHLTYSYSYGLAGRIALKTYLGTVGNDKVGFTVVGKKPGGAPDYIDGVRGLVERNTMRYFLGIDAYLASAAVPPATQRETRLQNWFAATERYPLQLHEVDRAAYLAMKHSEYRRLQTVH
jgi:hypothetical protein